jgi:hypothetical protein
MPGNRPAQSGYPWAFPTHETWRKPPDYVRSIINHIWGGVPPLIERLLHGDARPTRQWFPWRVGPAVYSLAVFPSGVGPRNVDVQQNFHELL